MKGIVNVSIAGIAFKLEDEAFARLERYLNDIRSGYGNTADGEEIMSDIEARIAEIILTQQNASVVVPLSLINSVLDRLGAPEDISEGAPANAANQERANATGSSTKSIPHRLYRNPEGAKFGGVCSGLAAYFNVDPVWIRLLFAAPLVLLVFFTIIHWRWLVPTMTGFMTTAFILYFLLWIVIPKAKTPLQKLEMKGEKITKDTLEQSFREEFQSRSNDPQNIELRARNERNASVFSEFVSIIGKILLFCAKALAAIIGFSLMIAIVGIIVALAAVLIGGPAAIHGITSTSPTMLAVLLLLAVLIPLSLAVYGILKMLFGFNQNKPFVTTLLVIWVLTLVFGTVIFIKDHDNIRFDRHVNIGWNDGWWERRRDREDRRENRRAEQEPENGSATSIPFAFTADTLFVAPMDSLQMPDNFVVKIRNGSTHYSEPTLVVRRSGKDNRPAGEEIPGEPTIGYTLRNDTLYLNPATLETAANERSEVNIHLPLEKTVIVSKGINYNEYFDR